MATFLLIRLLRWSVGLLLILFIAYAMMYYGAGDPIRMMFIQGEDFDSEDEVVMLALRKKYGLDDPFLVQFGNYLNNLLQGDWVARSACRSTVRCWRSCNSACRFPCNWASPRLSSARWRALAWAYSPRYITIAGKTG